MRARVLASLRSADLERLPEEMRALEAAGVDGYHLDVMDGQLVPEEAFSVEFCAEVRSLTDKLIDVHLMVEFPQAWVGPYAEAGANRVSFHIEATPSPMDCVETLADTPAQPGIVCFPGTELDTLVDVLPHVSVVNPLGVDPRHQLGFQDSTYERIRSLVRTRDAAGFAFTVQADGGVWQETRDGLVEAGAEELVGGYPIFSAKDYGAAVRELRG